MAKRKFVLTQQEVDEIIHLLNGRVDAIGQRRLSAVLAYHAGENWASLTIRSKCSRSTLYHWCRTYRKAGIFALIAHPHGGHNTRLSPLQLVDLANRISTTTPREIFTGEDGSNNEKWTVKDLYRAIRLWYGVVYSSPTTYYGLLVRFRDKKQEITG